jgi:hypothetical protein
VRDQGMGSTSPSTRSYRCPTGSSSSACRATVPSGSRRTTLVRP